MSTKTQVLAKAKKCNCEVSILRSDEDWIIEIDAWNQVFSGFGQTHGMTASGETAREAYEDAIRLMEHLQPCVTKDCTDSFHR